MTNKIIEIVQFVTEAFVHSWPYLLLTIPLAVAVKVSGVSRHINTIFGGKPLLAIFLATAAGAFSPFCSCGVIPIISALLISGVPVAPVMSFWLASPSMDPEIFFLSVSQLGWDLAVWRLAGTFIMSLGGGYITHFLQYRGWISPNILRSDSERSPNIKIRRLPEFLKGKLLPRPLSAAGAAQNGPDTVLNCSAIEQNSGNTSFRDSSLDSRPVSNASPGSCSGNAACGLESETTEPTLWFGIIEESQRAVLLVLKFMVIAFFLEALIVLYLPKEWISTLLGDDNRFSILIAVLIGIPLYTTNLTALGLIGGLLEQGMSPGAGLAFLMAGATTTIPAMAAVFGIVKRRIFILYLEFTFGFALLTGSIYQLSQWLF